MKKLEPLSANMKVPCRNFAPTEFEVQAELYIALKNRGFDVRGEIQFKDRPTRKLYRLDLVIYENGQASEIIEVKSAPIAHRNGLEATRQGRRYRNFGVPVTFVYGIEDARQFIAERR